MKSLLTLSLLSILVVSCGPSPEEQEAIKSLESRKFSLEMEQDNLQHEKKFWFKSFEDETDVNTKYAYGLEYQKTNEKLEVVEKELSDVNFQLSQL
jgi:spermidine/putrescine-binding protein